MVFPLTFPPLFPPENTVEWGFSAFPLTHLLVSRKRKIPTAPFGNDPHRPHEL